jgi:uncharacterized protein YeaO (DUF488 family)
LELYRLYEHFAGPITFCYLFSGNYRYFYIAKGGNMIRAVRIYEPKSKNDGYRVFVERLWPRGFTKEKARLDLWLKDIAPSQELRKWYSHDPEKWSEFKKRYKAELKNNKALPELKKIIKEKKNVDLVYAASDPERNSAVILKELIEKGK